jgi:regulator of protease activity HflC (stomatin/prohibitin superfamily)
VQAIAAVQVSAAAQRAEAEAQKHLVVHAQVAAQAQQLQAKAVNLQVGGWVGGLIGGWSSRGWQLAAEASLRLPIIMCHMCHICQMCH